MTSDRKKKTIYIITVLIFPILMYSVCSMKVYGSIYFPGGNGNRMVWDIEKLNTATKDFELQEDGSFLSVSPDPWFTIEEGFPVKTILIEIREIEEPQNAQVFYYSDSQELNEKNSYYFKLKQGVNYLQIPDGRFTRFRMDMTDSAGIRLYIDNVTMYGSRAVSSRSLILLLGIWGILAKCLYHIIFCKDIKGHEQKHTKGFYILTIGLSILYSVMFVVGRQLDMNTALKFTGKTFALIVALSIIMCLLLFFLTSWLDRRQEDPHEDPQNNRKILLICFIVLSIVWLLTYLALFPGVYSTDAPYWYYEFSMEGVPISSQWSPFYCFIFYSLVKTGEGLFGTFNAGFAVFSFVQMLFILYVIWQILSFLNKRFRHFIVIAASVFFALLPTHAILALTSAQDPAFAACFAMCVICLFEMAEAPELYWKKRSNFIKLCVWLMLLCMVRNNGLYAVFTMCFFIWLSMKVYWKQMLKMITVVFVFMLLYQGPVYNALGVQKGTAIREMLSLPLQQMGYAYNYGHERLSQEEVNGMLGYLSDEGWRTYEPCIADHLKSQLNTEKVENNIWNFLKVYIDVFLSVPDCYIEGAALQTFGLWYPHKQWPDARTWHPYLNYICANTYGKDLIPFTVTRSSLIPSYEKVLSVLYGQGTDYTGYGGNLTMIFSQIPVLGILSEVGIYFWFMMYLFSYAIYRKWREPFMIIGIGIGIFLTVFLSPVILYRYCAPMIFTAPLFAAVLFTPWKKEGE